jgi:D-alanyl-D-alanine carboxypeptidase
MKKTGIFKTIALAMAFGSSASAVQAQRPEDRRATNYAAIVIDAQTGETLYERGADRALYPASTTKLMTTYLTFEALRSGRLSMNDTLRVSANAASRPATHVSSAAVAQRQRYKKKDGTMGTRTVYVQRQVVFNITVTDALNTLLVHSANDIAVVLAEHLAGSEAAFARQMNEKARDLGMENTRFVNANGLPDTRQRTTVADMARLARAILRDFPEYAHLFRQKTITFNGRTYKNHNNLLSEYEGMEGLKTGFIRASGFNLAASAQRDNTRIIGVIFGATSTAQRKADMTRLLDFGFKKLEDPEAVFTARTNAAAATASGQKPST